MGRPKKPPTPWNPPAPSVAQTQQPPTLAEMEREPDLVDRIFDYLLETLPHSSAAEIRAAAVGLKTDLRAEFGGRHGWVYSVPRTQRQERVRKVLELFNGRNATEVARRIGVSRATVYRYIKQPGR